MITLKRASRVVRSDEARDSKVGVRMKTNFVYTKRSSSDDSARNDFDFDSALERMNRYSNNLSVRNRIARPIDVRRRAEIESGAMTKTRLASS